MDLQALFAAFLASFEDHELVISDSSSYIDKKQLLSYSEWIDSHATLLRNNIVGLYLPRSSLYICLYIICLVRKIPVVPLNTDWSHSYLEYVASEAGITTIIQSKAITLVPESLGGEILVSADLFSIVRLGPTSAPHIYDLAYTIFTSGSSGSPKGVNICLSSFEQYLRYSPVDDLMGQKGYHLVTGVITFDIILADIAVALKHKRGLRISTHNKDILDVASQLLLSDTISIYSVPSLYQKLFTLLRARGIIDRDKKLVIYSGGESLRKSLCKMMWDSFSDCSIYNMYGPTECTINCMSCPIYPEYLDRESLPTGRGYGNLEYFFDDISTPCSPSSTGELIISGPQLLDSFTSLSDTSRIFTSDGQRFYLTGDIFTMGKDGFFYFIGRSDSEVKVLGNRCNLQALEEFSLGLTGIADIVFMVDDGNLVCFVVLDGRSQIDLSNEIRKCFPPFCIPTKIFLLDSLPVNANGKLDRKALLTNDYDRIS